MPGPPGLPRNGTAARAVLALTFAFAGCQAVAPAPDCREVTARTFKVLRVVDGDTFKILYDGEPTSVRIVGINAPELRDPGGPEAKAALDRLIGGRTVRLEFTQPHKRDNFGRLLCKVFRNDRNNLDVPAEMVRLGHAKPCLRGR